MALRPLLTSVDTQVYSEILSVLEGGGITTNTYAAVDDFASFVFSQLPTNAPVPAPAPAQAKAPMSAADCKNILRTLASAQPGQKMALNINWLQLLQTILSIIMPLL